MLKILTENFKHKSINKKLIISFLIIFILTATVAVTGIVSLVKTRRSFSYMINYPLERYLRFADAKYQLMSIRRDFTFLAILAGEEHFLNERLAITLEALDLFVEDLESVKKDLNKDRLLSQYAKENQSKDIDYMIYGAHIFRDKHLLPFYEYLVINELSRSEIQAVLYEGIAIINPFVEVLNVMLASAELTMRNTQSASNALSLSMLWLLVFTALVSAVISLLLARFISEMISKPIIKLVGIADNVANGNLDVNFDIESRDETGVLSKRFLHVVGVINMFLKDLQDLGHAFEVHGDTTGRLNESWYKGAYANVASAINHILEYHVSSKDEILECISNIVDGEYDAPLRQFPGRESRINVSVDILRINVRRMEQIMMQKMEADAANKAKSSFLANMSHEIRTPMNAIMGVTEILLQKENLTQDISEGLNKIYISCDLLLGIINDILDFSKIEAGKLDIIPAKYNLASVINDSIQLNIMRIEGKPINFELIIDENIPAKLIGDELRIKQILNNLLSNAFKYTDAGNVTLTVSFKPIENKDSINLVLSVKDTGHGMTQEQLNTLFIEYSRFHQRINRTIEGTGLGLSITLSLVELMGGDINVESEPNIGSTFTVEFPQITVDSEIIGKELAENLKQLRLKEVEQRRRHQIIRDPMPYGRVLIVDDVETNLFVAEGLMKLYKLQIDSVMSGQDAIDKINEGNEYDVIFMDHMMPEMDGIETTLLLRKAGYTHPIIALTANAVSGQADMFLQNGFDEFISKPIDIRQLNTILNKYIRDKQPPEVIETARLQNGLININDNEDKIENSRAEALLMESFIHDANKIIALLEELLQNNKLEDEKHLRQFTISVHGIKSSLANIGETQLSKTAYGLEQNGKDRNIDVIKKDAPGFLLELKKLLDRIKKTQSELKDNTKDETIEDPSKINEIQKKLINIQQACSDYDRKLALDTLAEINYSSKWTKQIIEKITEYVIHSEFEKAEREAAAYVDILYGR